MSIVQELSILVFMESGIGPFVRERRTKLGLSQTALAEKAGLTKGHLSTLESGKIALPAADVRRRLAAALGVSHVALLVAAGELTDAEMTSAGMEGVVQHDPFPKRERLLNRIRALKWETGVETALEVTVRVLEELEREKGRG